MVEKYLIRWWMRMSRINNWLYEGGDDVLRSGEEGGDDYYHKYEENTCNNEGVLV